MCPAGKSRQPAAGARKPAPQAAAAQHQPSVGASDRRQPDINSILDAVRKSEELQHSRRPACGGQKLDSAIQSTAPTDDTPSFRDAHYASLWRTTIAHPCHIRRRRGRSGSARSGPEDIGCASGDEDEPGALAGRRRPRRRRRNGKGSAPEGSAPGCHCNDSGREGEPEAEGSGAPAPVSARTTRTVVTLHDLGLGDLTPGWPSQAQSVSGAVPVSWPAVEQPALWSPARAMNLFSTSLVSLVSPQRQRPLELFGTTPMARSCDPTCTLGELDASVSIADAGARELLPEAAAPQTPAVQQAMPDLAAWLLAGQLPHMSGGELEAHLKAVAPESYED